MAMDLNEVAKELPREALPVLQQAGYFDADLLEVGSAVPVFTLTSRADGQPVSIGRPDSPKSTVLIFGSYT
jgi:hypothetical protein